jgi:hypothetical protein
MVGNGAWNACLSRSTEFDDDRMGSGMLFSMQNREWKCTTRRLQAGFRRTLQRKLEHLSVVWVVARNSAEHLEVRFGCDDQQVVWGLQQWKGLAAESTLIMYITFWKILVTLIY